MDLPSILAFLGFCGLVGWWLLNLFKTKSAAGTLHGKSGKNYMYVLGDDLSYANANSVWSFKGIDIILPMSTALPHIYLDGKVRERTLGPQHFMPKNQQLQLEGDFNKYFNCYVPKNYQVLALSILTPDVMETLRTEVPDCDVQFYHDRLQIIVNHKVYGRPEATAALLRAADKVLQEVDHKLRTWSEADSQAARHSVLISEDNPTVKVFGRGLRLTTVVLGTLYGILGVVVWWALLSITDWPAHATFAWFVARFWPAILFFPVLWLLVVFGAPRGWFSWIGWFVDRR